MTLDLSQMIVDVASATGEANPAAVADKVLTELLDKSDPAILAEAVAEMLPEYTRRALHMSSRDVLREFNAGESTQTEERKPNRFQARRPDARSPIYDERVYSPEFGWTLLGDSTRPVLRSVAEYRRLKARQVYASGARIDAIADLLPDDETTADTIPPELIAAVHIDEHGADL